MVQDEQDSSEVGADRHPNIRTYSPLFRFAGLKLVESFDSSEDLVILLGIRIMRIQLRLSRVNQFLKVGVRLCLRLKHAVLLSRGVTIARVFIANITC
jgi:hypothetical protein